MHISTIINECLVFFINVLVGYKVIGEYRKNSIYCTFRMLTFGIKFSVSNSCTYHLLNICGHLLLESQPFDVWLRLRRLFEQIVQWSIDARWSGNSNDRTRTIMDVIDIQWKNVDDGLACISICLGFDW